MILFDVKQDTFVTVHNFIRVYITDPTDGGVILRGKNRDMIYSWCKENCQGAFWVGMGFGDFESENDAVLFRLTWNERKK